MSPTTIIATAGNGASGTVSVINPYGTAYRTGFLFVPPPAISSFTPDKGQSGTTVFIKGTHLTRAQAVYFDGSPAQSFSVLSDTSIAAIAADGGSGYIEVLTYGGKAASATMFTFPAPHISSFTPSSGNAGTTVVISGTNFRANPSDNIVYFGAGKATVTAASHNSLTVVVPAGTTHEPIAVTTNRSVSYSRTPFSLTYPDTGFDSASFAWKAAFIGKDDQNKVWLSDMDGDGKTDMLILTDYVTSVSAMRNTSTNGNITFAPNQVIDGQLGLGNAVAVTLNDLNGDGKPEVMITNTGSGIRIYRNTSQPGNISFVQDIDLQGDFFNDDITTGDFDNDGKIDIAVAGIVDFFSDMIIAVYRNTTSDGVISFAPRIQFESPYPVGLLTATDLDQDGKTDLVGSLRGGFSLNFFAWRNTSSAGNISFGSLQSFDIGKATNLFALGDLNGDGKPEVVTTSYADATNNNINAFTILKNNSTSAGISFEPKIVFLTSSAPGAVTIGQLDGDTKPDLAISMGDSISVLGNTSTASTISFGVKHSYAAELPYKGVYHSAIGDIDGDGKPDICETHGYGSLLSVLKNREGKKITNVCSAAARIGSGIPGGYIYHWQVRSGNGFINLSDNTIYSGVNNDTLAFTSIPADLNNNEYRCVVDYNVSNRFVLHVTESVIPSVAITASTNNICSGAQVTFTATPANGGTTPAYQWQINDTNTGTNSNIFTTSILHNNDQVTAIVTSNATCPTTASVVSAPITMVISATQLLGKAMAPERICADSSYQVSFQSINLATGSSVQLWENINNGTFRSGATQIYTGADLHFFVTDNNEGKKNYFFKMAPPTGNTCTTANNSDTSQTIIDKLATPIVAINDKAMVISNPDAGAIYKWQSVASGNWVDIPAANGTSYATTASGTYRVQGDKGQCTVYSNEELIVASGKIIAYPNPTYGTLSLDSLSLLDNWETLQIVNLQSGQTITSINIANQTKVFLHLETLSKGMYLAVLRRRNGASTSIKFLKL